MFLGIIFLFETLFVVLPKKDKDDAENRKLAELPKFKIAKLDPFPKAFESYYNDHFPFRNDIIKTYNKFSIRVLKKSPVEEKAIIGSSGWLFMGGNYLDGFQGKSNFTGSELEQIWKELLYRKNYCNKRGIKFYFVIIPQKSSVYPEYISSRYKFDNKYTPRTQLTAYLTKQQFPFCDLTQKLIENKNSDYDLYFKTDNHWNALGAFYGTQQILGSIRNDFPQVKPLSLNDYTISTETREGGNIAQMLSMKNEFNDIEVVLNPKFETQSSAGKKANYAIPKNFPYPWYYERVYENPSANKLKILVIRESFCHYQISLYSEHFGRSVFIFDNWKHQLNEDIIENEKPDIVVIQILESFLDNLLKYPSNK